MSITINHQTNDISATSGSITLDGAAAGGGGSMTYISTQTVTSATAQVEFDLSSSSYGSYIIKAHDCAFTASPGSEYCLYFIFYDGAYNPSSISTNRMSLLYQRYGESGGARESSSAWSYNTTLRSGTSPTTATKFGFIADIGGKTNSPVKIDGMFVTGTSVSAAPRITGIAPNPTNNMNYVLVKPSSSTFATGKFILYGIKDS